MEEKRQTHEERVAELRSYFNGETEVQLMEEGKVVTVKARELTEKQLIQVAHDIWLDETKKCVNSMMYFYRNYFVPQEDGK